MSFFATLPDDIQRLARLLRESKAGPLVQLSLVVNVLGYEEAMQLAREAVRTQMPTPDGKRQRTPGGVFFYLAQQRIAPETWAEINRQRQARMKHWLTEVASPVAWQDAEHRHAIAEALAMPPIEAQAVTLRGYLQVTNKIITPDGRWLALAEQPWPPHQAFLRNIPMPPISMQQRNILLLNQSAFPDFAMIRLQGLMLFNQRMKAMVAVEKLSQGSAKHLPSLVLHVDVNPQGIARERLVVISQKLVIMALTVKIRDTKFVPDSLRRDIVKTYIAHFPMSTWHKVKSLGRVTITGTPVWDTAGHVFLLAQSVVSSHRGNTANIRQEKLREKTAKKLAHVS